MVPVAQLQHTMSEAKKWCEVSMWHWYLLTKVSLQLCINSSNSSVLTEAAAGSQ